jgi:hypothetical protein
MTFADRVQALAAHGFTERQAGFLLTVMLHGGICMERQYCAFARIRHGAKSEDFFAKLVARRFASVHRAAHGRARLFHVHHRALYEAIGEPHNRHRKAAALPRAIERLMLLDAVLASREMTWLATERDKLAYFAPLVHGKLQREHLPHLRFGNGTGTTIRYFPDKLPIGLDGDGREHVFTYLITRSAPVDFRQFLHRHAELLGALPRWTIRLLVPPHLQNAVAAYEVAWRDEFASPLRPAVLDELRWYFEERRRLEQAAGLTTDDHELRFRRADDAFAAPRYRVLYRMWLEQGESALASLTSPVLADAIARGNGQIDRQVLAHQYLHLSPLVTTA